MGAAATELSFILFQHDTYGEEEVGNSHCRCCVIFIVTGLSLSFSPSLYLICNKSGCVLLLVTAEANFWDIPSAGANCLPFMLLLPLNVAILLYERV